MTDTTPTSLGSKAPSSGTISGLFALLLRSPEEIVAAAAGGRPELAARLLAGALVSFAAYGAAVGMFGGGWQIAVAMLKVPLVILATLLLCLPSFHVFSALAGSKLTFRESATVLLGFAGMLSLLLLGFLPITWLFSASSRSPLFLTWMNVLLWGLAVIVSMRFLRLAPQGIETSGRTVFFWCVLFLLVSLQMTTHLRPILWEPGDDLFTAGKLSFFEHLSRLK